jgi:hypothetical protein
MPSQKIIALLSVFSVILILSSTYFMMERDRLLMAEQLEATIDFPDTETQKSPNIEEEIKEVKMSNAFSFIIISSTSLSGLIINYIKHIPIVPYIETITPPPNF